MSTIVPMSIPCKTVVHETCKSIPLCVPEICGNEWAYIKECLDTNWVSSIGPFVDRFEREFAGYVGSSHAVAVSNGTAALHIALLVSGIKPDDEVLVPSLTFIAPANAVRYAGAWPVFMDAEPEFMQMDPEKTRIFLETGCTWKNNTLINKASGRRIKAILPVHILGHPVDMNPIIEIAEKYHLIVIEDATESLGAQYKNKKTGTLGHIACFSFNGNKLMTTGGGGMIVTNNASWAEKAKYLTTQAKDDPVEYIHHEIGYNYRLTNIQAAMGCAQLEKIDDFLRAKRLIARRYHYGLSHIPEIISMKEAPEIFSAFWMYTIQFSQTNCRELFRKLENIGIQTRPLWQPLHQSPAHKKSQSYKCDVSEWLYRHCLSLPCSVGLSESDQERVIRELVKLV